MFNSFSVETDADFESLLSRRLSADTGSLNVDNFFSDLDERTEFKVTDRGPSERAIDADVKLMSLLSPMPTLLLLRWLAENWNCSSWNFRFTVAMKLKGSGSGDSEKCSMGGWLSPSLLIERLVC